MRRIMVVVIFAACSSDDRGLAAFERVEGAPPANWGMTYSRNGTPVVLGGASTFSELYVTYLRDDGVWQPMFEPIYTPAKGGLLRGAEDRLLVRVGDRLRRLDDEVNWVWSEMFPPADLNVVAIYGQDDAGAVYGLDGSRGLVRWRQGEMMWTVVVPVPTFNPQGAVIVRANEIVWPSFDETTMVGTLTRWNVSGGESQVIVDCNVPDLERCEDVLSPTFDGGGNLYFMPNRDHIFRLAAGATTPERLVDTPAIEFARPRGLQSLADGTLFYQVGETNVEGVGGLYRLEPGSDTLDRVADISTTYFYVAWDARTVYGYGDGSFGLGVVRSTP